jgi:hypothetical protein
VFELTTPFKEVFYSNGLGMVQKEHSAEIEQALERVLGHLNFASGTPNPKTFAAINTLFAHALQLNGEQPWQQVGQWLGSHLESLRTHSPVFTDAAQVQSVLPLIFQKALPGFMEHHADLLFHQSSTVLFNSLFVGRMIDAILLQGGPWIESDRILKAAFKKLNDYLGHRPIAILETRKVEPYAQEWVRPIPLFIEGAGVAAGRYQHVVELALNLLRNTHDQILHDAYFDPNKLSELAFDPRAYDFDHPANKRPNYHFGQWDPHCIDNHGHYRRFVVQQVTLDSLMNRVETEKNIPFDEIQLEAAAVLAGTILMASGISGEGPETHDSNVNLANLLPRIAGYRDMFYEQLMEKLPAAHGKRLKKEAKEKRQPFGGARQHLNAQLARRRAAQLEHVHVAQIYARLGFPGSAYREADVVPCASARMLCHIDCLLSAVDLALERKQHSHASLYLPEIIDWLHRAIECGAMVDPWNILGFDAQYSLFPCVENSVRDHRVDDLIGIMEQIFSAHARVWSEAAAIDDKPTGLFVSKKFKELAQWWHQFAVHEVSSVEALNSLDVFRAAEHVVQALNLWHKGNAAAGDIKFWAKYTGMFDTPKAYALVVDALLDRGDLVASQALLVHWLSQAENIGLSKADVSFHELVERWFFQDTTSAESGKRAFRFLDLLEANAEKYWQVPDFELTSNGKSSLSSTQSEPEADEDLETEENDGKTFDSAYENMLYKDTTDDGFEGQVFDPGMPSHDLFLRESKRIIERLEFLSLLARLWRMVAIRKSQNNVDSLAHCAELASTNYKQLLQLIDTVQAYKLPITSGDHDSMLEYDRVRLAKESLLDRIIVSAVETADAQRLLIAALGQHNKSENTLLSQMFHAAIDGNANVLRECLPAWFAELKELPLLYVPLSKGGEPRNIVETKVRQHAVEDMLLWLPRCGLLFETCQLIETARDMERLHPVGPGAVTEFDEMFKIGYRSIVEAIVDSSQNWGASDSESAEDPDSAESSVVACLEQLTESILVSWLAHSRTLRLSVLERVHDKKIWTKLVDFIERFGAELFTQRFLNMGNARGILHQGTLAWLKKLMADPPPDAPEKLLEAIEGGYALHQAADQLSLVLESIVENYGEYRDYNSTTTQSDRGELLYMLLDFLRLRTKYDRVCWNLKPVVIAHEILVRRGHDDAARMWRRALAERITEEAEQYLTQLAALQKQYAMRMPTVADRLNERFLRPLAIDRIRALVVHANREAKQGGEAPMFELLEEEIDSLTREPTGVGLDVPAWIVALEEEVDRSRRPTHQHTWEEELKASIPAQLMTLEEVQNQLDSWTSR